MCLYVASQAGNGLVRGQCVASQAGSGLLCGRLGNGQVCG